MRCLVRLLGLVRRFGRSFGKGGNEWRGVKARENGDSYCDETLNLGNDFLSSMVSRLL
jgi:hypothetical protein